MILKTLPLVGEGTLEICTHPGFCDEELIASSSWNVVREVDHSVLYSLAKEKWFKSHLAGTGLWILSN